MMSATQLYRCGRWCNSKGIPLVPKIMDYLTRLVFACWFPHSIECGADPVLGYGGLAIVVHGETRLGDRVHIDQGVTIGGNGTERGVPNIGSDVYIGAGAKVLGPITIGDGTIIGANAVVLNDLPARCIAVGIPARVVRQDIDIDQHLSR